MHVYRFASAAFCAIFAAALPSLSRACSGGLHIELADEGVYALDHASIVAGQPSLADCASDELVLTQNGAEVPIRIVGDANGRFVDGARIEWIGEPLHGSQSWMNPFASFNAYQLTAKPGSHARMREAAAASGAAAPLRRRVHLEEQHLLVRLDVAAMKPGDEPDVWTWSKLAYTDKEPFALAFDVDDLARAASDAKVTLAFRGISAIYPRPGERKRPVMHAIDVSLNGKPLTTLEWDGYDTYKHDVALPRALLRAGANRIEMHVPTRERDANGKFPKETIVDIVMFDAADLDYPVGGDLAASRAPFDVAAVKNAPATVDVGGVAHDVAFYTSAGDFRDAGAGGRARFEVSKPGARVFPVAGEARLKPLLVRAMASKNLRDAAPGYDYLVISHRTLMDAVRPLVELHEKQGLKVALVDVDDIYDEFSGGVALPHGIRDYIAYGEKHWDVKPRYVLLVGTASFDLRHAADPTYNESQVDPRTGAVKVKRADTAALAKEGDIPPDRNLIPTWQVPTPEGQAASDNRFVAFKDKDFHPSVAIGRFPVVTPEEVSAIVKKTIDYATSPPPGAWRSRVMFIANEDEFFKRSSDKLADELEGEGFTPVKIYADAVEKDNAAHQASIVADLDEGALLVHFLGHGGRFIWRSGPPDYKKNHDLFTLDHVSSLKNGGRLPMVLSMTCYSGSFDNPNSDTISERFLREPDKGAVAVFSASWRNSPSPAYSQVLVDGLMTPGERIGDAIVAAKQKERDRVLVETYNLFGDPALVLNRPTESIRIARNPDRWNEGVAVRLPEGGFGDKVTVSWLDARGTEMKTQTYATNERQFALNAPSKGVAAVNVYAENAAGTRHAIGNFDFRPPPPPPEPAKPAPKIAAAKPAAPAPPAAPRPNQPDAIASNGFDGTAKAKPDAKSKAKVAEKSSDKSAANAREKSASNARTKTLGAAVAVEKGSGEGEP
jgi:hypothetical protein